MFPLAEIILASKQQADSVYLLLKGGADFDSLARHSSVAESRQYGGALGAVDIAVYPQNVRIELQRLTQGEITPPLRIGDRYAIFKRYRL